jgi:hypothetical protein
MGDDILFGENGNDVYVYNKNDGFDIIHETNGNNVLQVYGYGLEDTLTVEYPTSDEADVMVNGEKIIKIGLSTGNEVVGFSVEFYHGNETPDVTVLDSSSGNDDADLTDLIKRSSWLRLSLEYMERLFDVISNITGQIIQ